MNTQENRSWFFPVANFGTKQGLNDSGLETFLDKPLEGLVRETIQNSLDAVRPDTNDPVRVMFDFFERPIGDIPGLDSLKNEYLPSALSSWEKDSKEYEYLRSVERHIKQSPGVKILRIADYNTTGLDERNWDALVKETGVSSKRDTQAAGSKGIGKNAPFAASSLRTVMYSTKTDTYERSIGVMIGVSYLEPGGGDGISQSRGYLGSQFNKPFNHQYSFFRDRDEVGTDVFVVGVKREYASAQNSIILSVLKHFILSIHNGSLEVAVDGDLITKENLKECVDSLSSDIDGDAEVNELESIRCYLEVLTSPDTRVIPLDDSFVRTYDFIKSASDATLMLLPADQLTSTNKVLLARKSGMTIKEKSFRMGVYFSGIFQATGDDLNTFLRKLESAEHDEWVAERSDYADRQIAKRFLRELEVFLRESIRSLIENDNEDVVDAYGMAELLPDESDSEVKGKENEATSIEPLAAEVTIKPLKKVKQQLRYEEELPEEDGGSGGPDGGEGGRKQPGVDRPGAPKPNPEPPRGSPEKSLVETDDAKIRLVETDYRQGLYVLRAVPGHTLHDARIKIVASGENADYDVTVLSANGAGASVVGGDSVQIPMLPANILTEVNIKINYSFRVRMKAVVYESK